VQFPPPQQCGLESKEALLHCCFRLYRSSEERGHLTVYPQTGLIVHSDISTAFKMKDLRSLNTTEVGYRCADTHSSAQALGPSAQGVNAAVDS